MLEHLFGSKTRSLLLQLFFNHPARQFFVREISRLSNIQLNAVRRELMNLEKMNLVTSSARTSLKSQKKFFKLNSDSSFYPELKALMLKTQCILEQDLAQKIAKLGKVEYLVLTGQFVGDTEVGTDILIVGNVNRKDLKDLLKGFEKIFAREINYTVMTHAEFLYRKEVMDKFLYQILDGKKIEIVS